MLPNKAYMLNNASFYTTLTTYYHINTYAEILSLISCTIHFDCKLINHMLLKSSIIVVSNMAVLPGDRKSCVVQCYSICACIL